MPAIENDNAQAAREGSIEKPPVDYTITLSVIMPAYNAERTIQQSISSVLVQSFADWELIIVEDCSQDATVQKIKEIIKGDPRVKLYINEKNLGASKSRNIGIKNARGDWVAFLDSDDIWVGRKLEKQMKFIEETGALISYTGTAYMDSAGSISGYVLHAKRELTYRDLLKRNLMSCSSVIVRRDIIGRIGFAEGDLHEDYAVWMRILKEVGRAFGLDEPLLIYRVVKGSKSAGRLRSAKMTYYAYRQLEYTRFLALLLTMRYALHSISKRFLIKLKRNVK